MVSRESYLRVFAWHDLSGSDIYQDEGRQPAIDRAFGQVADLLRHSCSFNDALPWEFREPLRAWRAGDSEALRLFEEPARRAFFLSDFWDWLHLPGR